MKPPVAYAIERIRGLAGPGPYEARQSDQSALAQSMAADVDPLLAHYDRVWSGLTGEGQGGSWFGMNSVTQELRRLHEMNRAAARSDNPLTGPEGIAYLHALFDSPLAPGFGVMATVGDVAQGAARLAGDVGITAYHGSPHTFDRFDMSKIGTGEGAQAYGHGLYFAENEGVARQYRDALSRDRVTQSAFRVGDRDITRSAGSDWFAADLADMFLRYGGGDPSDPAVLAEIADNVAATRMGVDAADGLTVDRVVEFMRQGVVRDDARGRMYEVRINANPDDFLDWDKPLSEQSERVRQALAMATETAPEPKKGPAIRNRAAIAAGDGSVPGDVLYNNIGGFADPAGTTNRLRELGIPGIKYLDAGSRAAGDGSRNYVVFDDKLIEILRRYGLLPPLAAGAATTLGGNEAEAGQ